MTWTMHIFCLIKWQILWPDNLRKIRRCAYSIWPQTTSRLHNFPFKIEGKQKQWTKSINFCSFVCVHWEILGKQNLEGSANRNRKRIWLICFLFFDNSMVYCGLSYNTLRWIQWHCGYVIVVKGIPKGIQFRQDVLTCCELGLDSMRIDWRDWRFKINTYKYPLTI